MEYKMLNIAAGDILSKALAADPAARYQSADDFAADLVGEIPLGAETELATLLHALFGPELRPQSAVLLPF